MSRALAAFASLFAVGLAHESTAAEETPAVPLSIEQRVEVVRRQFAGDTVAGSAMPEGDDAAAPDRTTQWGNWPNWPNWGNWANWPNWNNWNNWVNWWNN